MSYTVTMPYIGGILSKNRWKFYKSAKTRPEVVEWMNQLAGKVSGFKVDIPVRVTVSGRFKDGRYPDLVNLHDAIADALKVGLHLDDKYFIFQDKEVVISEFEAPEITIGIG